MFNKTLGEIKIGTYNNLVTVKLSTPVIQIISIFMKKRISAIPIVDNDGKFEILIHFIGVVLNVYENNDVLVNKL